MNGQALVDAYNQYVDKWRTSKFSSKSEGVEACNKAFEKFLQKTGMVEASTAAVSDKEWEDAAPTPVEEKPVEDEDHLHDLALISKMHCSDELKAKLTKLLLGRTGRKRPEGAPRRTRNTNKIIKIKALRNPRREGTKAWEHFEVMNSADVKTVADYLAKFPQEARKNANQWLSNTVADGFVELVDAD